MTTPALKSVLAEGKSMSRPSALSASLTFGWRSMLKLKHIPEQIFDVTVFPVLMTLMFTYLFGGALSGSTGDYLQFLLPGMLVTSVAMITMYTGTGINSDINKGIFDRIRTLPVWRPAALVGALLGDAVRYSIAAVTILLLGLLMGFRSDAGILHVLAAIGVLLVFAFAFSWIWTMFGLLLRSEKSVMSMSMLVVMPATFLSNVYVLPETMPGWLQTVVAANPITHTVSAVRGLLTGSVPMGWILSTLAISAGITLIFGFISMRLYNSRE
ncbi:ABC transporter permease [Saccharomonospora azurea]|uniref:Transport permease protein n=1 Tax=Saccharomonospora azurea NA-128 TaxID=882081 RepID=H8GEM4_9PSEU|nr:ABC transporter permease [Saccharomonospora azurea]EHK80175.1 ABC-transporter transmembrane protein [Saccharomonospora azurea SZMC 14600]EHK88437.1 ABC-transporter transmembrane protein [Saccharomonospora azurea SZMC 14600]EHY88969.1 ABC-type polysaccharide/polyol phosphate export system, permease component [Saccharomonospora azurea NA-128]